MYSIGAEAECVLFWGYGRKICIWDPFECDMGLDGTLTSHIERVTDDGCQCIFSHEISLNLSSIRNKN